MYSIKYFIFEISSDNGLDLVKKTKTNDVTDKNYNPKVAKLVDTINDNELTDKQMEDLIAAIQAKKNNPNKTKNI